jgi:hypothetical protein
LSNDIIYEEWGITTSIARSSARIQLTRDMFIVVGHLLPWSKRQIPLASVAQVQLYRDRLGEQIVVT